PRRQARQEVASLVRREDDLQAALLSRRRAAVRRENPVRPAPRSRGDEAAEAAAVARDPAVGAFAGAREAGEERGRDTAAGEEPDDGRERGAGAEAGRSRGLVLIEDQMPGGHALRFRQVGEEVVGLGGSEGERTEAFRSGGLSPLPWGVVAGRTSSATVPGEQERQAP